MRNIPFLLLLLCLNCSLPSADTEGRMTFAEDFIDVRFTTGYAQADLDRVKAKLAERGITIEYTLIEFNSFDMLSGLGFELRTQEGKQAASTARMLGSQQPFGFTIDYRTKPATVRVGQLRE